MRHVCRPGSALNVVNVLVQFIQATQAIETIATNLQTPHLRSSFLGAAPVLDIYEALGHRPPPVML